MTARNRTTRSWPLLVRHILEIVAAADPGREGWEQRAGDRLTEEFGRAPGPGDRLRRDVFEFLFLRVAYLEHVMTPEAGPAKPEPKPERNFQDEH